MVRTAGVHFTGTYISLRRMGDSIVWGFHMPNYHVSRLQLVDHGLPAMVRFVRGYLGQSWSPKWFAVDYEEDPAASLLCDAVQTDVHFGCDYFGIPIPIELADSPPRETSSTSPASTLTSVELMADVAIKRTQNLEYPVEAIVALQLLDGDVNIDGAARQAGMSVRTFQRRLNQNGLAYRDIVDKVRHRRARALIEETELSLTDIAHCLGYSDQANFTRAFTRWAGRAPSSLRCGGVFAE